MDPLAKKKENGELKSIQGINQNNQNSNLKNLFAKILEKVAMPTLSTKSIKLQVLDEIQKPQQSCRNEKSEYCKD